MTIKQDKQLFNNKNSLKQEKNKCENTKTQKIREQDMLNYEHMVPNEIEDEYRQSIEPTVPHQ